jgi:hypothetical protein
VIIRKVKVGDLIKRRWTNSPDPGIQIYLDFKRLRDYGIVLEVDHTNGMVKAHFFNQIYKNPTPVRVGYFDIIGEGDE